MYYADVSLKAVKAKRGTGPYSWAIYNMYIGRLMSRWGNIPRLF